MKLIIPCKDTIHVVKQQDILYCRSDNSYTVIFLINGEKLTVSKSLSKMVEKLSPEIFLRVNQSCVINMEKVNRINRREKVIELRGGEKVRFTIKVRTLIDSLGIANGTMVLVYE